MLRSRARPVEAFDETLVEEVRRMGRLMDDALGIGLAATQLGVMHRVLVYKVEPDAPLGVLVNPQIEWARRRAGDARGGLPVAPGVGVEVERPVYVRVRASDEHGAPLTVEAAGLEARVIQHEIDHLDGVLILDRTSRDQRKQAMRAMREAMRRARAVRRLVRHLTVRTVYLGTSNFAAVVLERLAGSAHRPQLVVTRPDRPKGRGRQVSPPPVAARARVSSASR